MTTVQRPYPVGNDLPKWVSGIMSGVVGMAAKVPHTIQDMAFVLFLLIVVDTITGVAVAGKLKVVSSRRMTDKLVSKLLAYGILIALACGGAILSDQWSVAGAGIAACMGIEVTSCLENLALLERYGGVNLGPAKPLISRLSKYLIVMQGDENGGPASPSRKPEPPEGEDR
jgi:phage-related holin